MEIRLMLKHFIYDEQFFSLDALNTRTENFAYGRTESRSKPPKAFTQAHINGQSKLPLSGTNRTCSCIVYHILRTYFILSLIAAQMWMFATLLPLIIGDQVPLEQPNWECFLLLLKIVKHCTSRVVSAATSAIVAALVDQHHQSFKICYPGVAFTPKLHYMVHFPQQLLRLVLYKCIIACHINCFFFVLLYRTGPLVTSWCMRMEAKNAYFKKVARIGNFKNAPYSVAKRHQHLLCAYLQGRFFSYYELQCGPCKHSIYHT